MPKERIRCANSTDSHAEVRWHPDNGEGTGHVQIATVRTVAPQVTMLTNQVTGTTTSASSIPVRDHTVPDELSGWFVDLDREQLNRMIRVLRRARDSAFGADA